MATTIEDYLTLSVADLRRLGYLTKNELKGGRVFWKIGDAVTAQIDITTDTRAVPMCYLSYVFRGETKQETIRLMWKHSNLDPDGEHGYYYFVCPVSGECCRKLYHVGGRFVGRAAFRPLYPIQVKSRKQRATSRLWDFVIEIEGLRKPYRKEYYRGKPTPYRLRWERYIKRNAKLDPVFSQFDAVLQSDQ